MTRRRFELIVPIAAYPGAPKRAPFALRGPRAASTAEAIVTYAQLGCALYGFAAGALTVGLVVLLAWLG